TIIDSLINSKFETFNRIKKIVSKYDNNYLNNLDFLQGDIRDYQFLEKVFCDHISVDSNFDAVIHLCGLKSVEESIKDPISYWDVNVLGTINLIKVMRKFECYNLLFSSSATVYGDVLEKPLREDSEANPVNTYGLTKATVEKILFDLQKDSYHKFKIAVLRFFNPVGAHCSGLIGELPSGKPNNIFPLIINTAYGNQSIFNIYGNDWPTNDGTPIRDYIHVMDLSESFIKILNYLISNKPIYFNLNIGTGKGTSVLELLKTFEKVNKVKVEFCFCKRRKGDVPFLVAENSLLQSKFNMYPKRDIESMCKDAWRWKLLNPEGY
ncbi:UDP-glucose 4-epimerase GalE, partial [Prochlorococcus sp. AH-716-P20]|nr:UDP-glucose 4-epimerase GalE [Prochlorococcus sp. AH-716-P20]